MQLKIRLTILFTVITATILLIFAAVIYYSAKESRENEFYESLRREAFTKANLFLNAKVDGKTLQAIYHNSRQVLNEVEVAIYDSSFQLMYHDAVEIDFVKEDREMLQKIKDYSKLSFYQDNWQVIGAKYELQGKEYLLTAAAYDHFGYIKIQNLLQTIIIVSFISLLILYLLGYLFVKKAFSPIDDMAIKASIISANNLDLRLETKRNNDELSRLANTFNKMLDRLEHSFDSQKEFVSNISHEVRTPLSAIIAELELAQNKDRTMQEYKEVISNSLHDAKKLAKLSNSLLDFAKASYDPSEIAFSELRVDEVLLDAQTLVQRVNPQYKIAISFEQEFEDEDQITILGNAYLLKVAFMNLMENGCKFSADQKSLVTLLSLEHAILIRFQDHGVGILAEDLPHIFTPFYRGENKNYTEGNGIGLPLTQRIINLHRGQVEVKSSANEGTLFEITLPTITRF